MKQRPWIASLENLGSEKMALKKSRGHPIFPLSWHTDTHAQFLRILPPFFLFKDLQLEQSPVGNHPGSLSAQKKTDANTFSMGLYFLRTSWWKESGHIWWFSKRERTPAKVLPPVSHSPSASSFFFLNLFPPHLINQGQLSSQLFFYLFLSNGTIDPLCVGSLQTQYPVVCARIFTSKRPWLTDLELFEMRQQSKSHPMIRAHR